jgi:hypothetical protein
MKLKLFLVAILLSLIMAVPVWAGEITQLKFVDSPTTVEVGQLSDTLKVQLQDSDSKEMQTTVKVDLNFSSSPAGGEFFSDTGKENQTYIRSGSANKLFRYKNLTPGVYTITVSAIGKSWQTTQTITVGATGGNSGGDNPVDEVLDPDSNDSGGGSSSTGSSAHEDPVELSDFAALATFKISAGRQRLVAVGSPVRFVAVTSGDSGKAYFYWSFGDGSQNSGKEVTHTYYAPGIYHVVLNARAVEQTAVARTQVEVFVPKLSLGEIDAQSGLAPVINNSEREINLGGWQLSANNKTFTIPADTIVGAKSKIIIPAAISQLAFAGAMSLQNPIKQTIAQTDGAVARREKILALQTQLAQARAQLAKLTEVEPRYRGSTSVTSVMSSTSPVSVVQSTTSVIELPRKTGWWTKLVNEIF